MNKRRGKDRPTTTMMGGTKENSCNGELENNKRIVVGSGGERSTNRSKSLPPQLRFRAPSHSSDAYRRWSKRKRSRRQRMSAKGNESLSEAEFTLSSPAKCTSSLETKKETEALKEYSQPAKIRLSREQLLMMRNDNKEQESDSVGPSPYCEGEDNVSSIATPEETAVSTMIMALEKVAPKGQFRRSQSEDGTPIRNNQTTLEKESLEDDRVLEDVIRRACSSSGSFPVREAQRVRFHHVTSKTKQASWTETAVVSKTATIQSEANTTDATTTQDEVVKSIDTREEEEAPHDEKSEDEAAAAATTSQAEATGARELAVSEKEEECHAKDLSSKSSLKDHYKGSSRKSKGHKKTAQRKKKQGRVVRMAPRPSSTYGDCDDLSVRSDPTQESSVDQRNEYVFDFLLDLVSFDIHGDEDTKSHWTETEDDDTFHSAGDGFEQVDKAAHQARYNCSHCMNEDALESVTSFQEDDDQQPSCHHIEINADTGKAVLTDMTSVIEESTQCQHMEAPTAVGKQVLSDISSVLSFQGDAKSSDGAEATTRGYDLSGITSSFLMDRVFRQEQPNTETVEEKRAAPEEATLQSAPIERVDSGQLTYISDLTSLAPFGAKSTAQEEVKRTPLTNPSPLTFSSFSTAQSATTNNGRQYKQYEKELKKLYDKAFTATRINEDPEDEAKTNQELSGAEKNVKAKDVAIDNVKHIPHASSLRSRHWKGGSPATAVSPNGTRTTVSENDESVIEIDTETLPGKTLMTAIQDSFVQLNAKIAANAHEENASGSNQEPSNFDEFLNAFQRIIACNARVPSLEKDKSNSKIDQLPKFLYTLSKSFTFWSKENDNQNKDGEDNTAANSPEMSTSTTLPGEQDVSGDPGRASPWENMERSFPKSTSPFDKEKSGGDDKSVSSETSLKRHVTVTISKIDLDLSKEYPYAPSGKHPSSPDAPSEHLGRYDDPQEQDLLDQGDSPADTQDEGRTEEEELTTTELREAEQLIDESLLQPPSPQYPVPSRSPSKPAGFIHSLPEANSAEDDLSRIAPSHRIVGSLRGLQKASSMLSSGSNKSSIDRIQSSQMAEESIKPNSHVLLTPPRPVRESITMLVVDDFLTRAQSDEQSESEEKLRAESTDIQEKTEDSKDESETPFTKTWPATDVNTSIESWQSFGSGDLFLNTNFESTTESGQARAEKMDANEFPETSDLPFQSKNMEDTRDESKDHEEDKEEFQQDDDLHRTSTWPNADVNTSMDSWQSFQNGEYFSSTQSEGLTQAEHCTLPSTKDHETATKPESQGLHANASTDVFQVTFQNNNVKRWTARKAKSSPGAPTFDSPRDVAYGPGQSEFTSFGRRSLLKALHKTTTAEI